MFADIAKKVDEIYGKYKTIDLRIEHFNEDLAKLGEQVKKNTEKIADIKIAFANFTGKYEGIENVIQDKVENAILRIANKNITPKKSLPE